MTDSASPVRQVTAAEGVALAAAGHRVVDVREPHEWNAGHVAVATHIPLSDLPARYQAELPDPTQPLLLYCRSGARSARASAFLAARGYSAITNLADLTERWPG